MIPAGPLFHKPPNFVAAKNLLYASICVGIGMVLMHKLIHGALDNGIVPGLALITIGYVLMFLIIKQMSLCKKWARTALFTICVLVAAAYLLVFKMEQPVNLVDVAIFILQVCLQAFALVFLYSKDCNIWFNSRTTEMLP
jgi:hypothetical protein